MYKKVVAYCKKEEISICAFEKKCGLGNGTVGRWKNGCSHPSMTTLEKIAKHTQISISEWLSAKEQCQ